MGSTVFLHTLKHDEITDYKSRLEVRVNVFNKYLKTCSILDRTYYNFVSFLRLDLNWQMLPRRENSTFLNKEICKIEKVEPFVLMVVCSTSLLAFIKFGSGQQPSTDFVS